MWRFRRIGALGLLALALVIPRGARRETRAVSERLAYLTVHRSRVPLLPVPEGT